MAETAIKLRLAMGMFDDLARMNAAAVALTDLGLEAKNLCFVTDRATVLPDSAGLWSAAGQTARLVCFQYAATPADASGNRLSTRAVCLMAGALDAAGAFSSHSLRASHVWSAVNTQLARGALLLTALVPNSPLQDRAVRLLLRHSPHPVHAEEFSLPVELS
jgi:hypothetical protein